ncbi:MAG: Hpt domain-containing protein [candidate division Zixibacteria bacterium]|nr:Hpt domain-containing protein [candidate division Zixibacteria bacterium]
MNFDYTQFYETVGEDEDLVKELISIFLEQYPQMMENIETAIKNKNSEELHKTSHKLKGSLSSMCANSSLDQIIALETMAINQDLDNTEITYSKLEKCISDLADELQDKMEVLS